MYRYIKRLTIVLVFALTFTCSASADEGIYVEPKKSWSQFTDRMQVILDQHFAFTPRMLNARKVDAIYKVLPNNALELEYGTWHIDHMILWRNIHTLALEPLDTLLSSFAIIHDVTEGAGRRILGFVYDEIDNKRGIAIDRHLVDDGELDGNTMVLIHEFGHIILPVSLELRQLIEECGEESAPGTKPFVEQFRRTFWSHCSPKMPVNHMTWHASRNISEDLAETWTSFVVCDKPGDESLRLPVEKVRFMWQDLELRNRRSHIHESLGPAKMAELKKGLARFYCRK